jgi:hypothetical protein
MLSLTDEATTQKLDAIDKVRLLLAIASTKCVFC